MSWLIIVDYPSSGCLNRYKGKYKKISYFLTGPDHLNASMCIVPVVTAIQKVSTAKPFLRWPRSNQPWPSFFCGRPFPGFFRFNADKPGCWEGKGKKGRTQCNGVKYFTKSLWIFTFLEFEEKFRKQLLKVN